jgi:hypothetical protein
MNNKMERSSQSSLTQQGLFSRARSATPLTDFISQLDKALQSENLAIVNGPNLNAKNLQEIQQVIGAQTKELDQYGRQCGATIGLVHFASPIDANDTRKPEALKY